MIQKPSNIPSFEYISNNIQNLIQMIFDPDEILNYNQNLFSNSSLYNYIDRFTKDLEIDFKINQLAKYISQRLIQMKVHNKINY